MMGAFAALAPLQTKLHDEQEDLADELMDKVGEFNLDALTTAVLCDEAKEWLRVRIAAMEAVREDEKSLPTIKWDHEWLGASKAAAKQARFLLYEVSTRAAAMREKERADKTAERNATAERLFVAATRSTLPNDQYLAIWEKVFTDRPDLRPQRKAKA